MSENNSQEPAFHPIKQDPYHTFPVSAKLPVGSVIMYAGKTNPTSHLESYGWMVCDGRILTAAEYPLLFAVIGCDYGGEYPNFKIPLLPDPNANQGNDAGNGSTQALSVGCYIICFM